LFEERFKAALVEKHGHLPELTRFVHRIVLKDNSASHLAEWRWSSYLSYIKEEQDKNIASSINCAEVLELLPGASGNKEISYRDFTEKAGQGELEAFENKMHRASVVGSEEFMEKVKQISKAAVEEVETER